MWVYIWTDTYNYECDFTQEQWWWTWHSIWAWTPAYTSWQWWTIGNSNSWNFAGNIIPPQEIYQWNLKKVKFYFYHPSSTTSSRGTAISIGDSGFTEFAEFWRYGKFPSWWCIAAAVWWSWVALINSQEVTWEVTVEFDMEDNWHITVILNGTYSYDIWAYASTFTTFWANKWLCVWICRWNDSNPYLRKIEIEAKW